MKKSTRIFLVSVALAGFITGTNAAAGPNLFQGTPGGTPGVTGKDVTEGKKAHKGGKKSHKGGKKEQERR